MGKTLIFPSSVSAVRAYDRGGAPTRRSGHRRLFARLRRECASVRPMNLSAGSLRKGLCRAEDSHRGARDRSHLRVGLGRALGHKEIDVPIIVELPVLQNAREHAALMERARERLEVVRAISDRTSDISVLEVA